jgi:cytochrome bd-type quinol oxidase subunit 2
MLSKLQKIFIELFGAFSIVVLLFAVGTLAYHNLEGWTYTDSFYFTGMTLTTIGYGDLHPTTNVSKIFTVFFALCGIGVVLLMITIISQYFFTRQKEVQKNVRENIRKANSKYKERLKRMRNNIIEGGEE